MKNLRYRIEKLEQVAANASQSMADFSHLSREQLEILLEEEMTAWQESEDGKRFQLLLENRPREKIKAAFEKAVEARKRGPARIEDFLD